MAENSFSEPSGMNMFLSQPSVSDNLACLVLMNCPFSHSSYIIKFILPLTHESASFCICRESRDFLSFFFIYLFLVQATSIACSVSVYHYPTYWITVWYFGWPPPERDVCPGFKVVTSLRCAVISEHSSCRERERCLWWAHCIIESRLAGTQQSNNH